MPYGEGMSVLNPVSPEIISQMLLELGLQHGRVLDVGCGRGATLLHLSEQFPDSELFGIDISPQIVSTKNIIIKKGKAEKLPFPSDFFDYILMECSFSLIDNSREAANSLYQVLHSEGLLLLTDIYTTDIHSCLFCENNIARHIYTANEINDFFYKAGFHLNAFSDRTDELTQMGIRLLMSDDCCMQRDQLVALIKEKPRYGLWLFQK